MDSAYNRVSVVFSTFITAILVAAFGNAIAVFMFPLKSEGSIQFTRSYDMVQHKRLKGDVSNVGFALNADLSGSVQWNTHQLFTYVVASYETEKYPRNELTIWDGIISSEDTPILDLPQAVNEYPMKDIHFDLRDRDVDLQLRYAYMPIVGAIRDFKVASEHFSTPTEYFNYKP